jgi:hypothetical protein
MYLTLDNHDGAGARDYTGVLEPGETARITRRLNRPATCVCTLVAEGGAFVVPVAGARMEWRRNDGVALFTGYLDASPVYEYLGWGPQGPTYRYRLSATADAALLDRRRLPERVPFTMRPAGDCLMQMAADVAPGAFDTSAVEAGETIHRFAANGARAWSSLAAELALRARSVWSAEDARLAFRPVGSVTHVLDEADEAFIPRALTLKQEQRLANDVTVVGRAEPREHVKDYFLGDGLTLQFSLSYTPFVRRSGTILEEEYRGAALEATRWSVTDPAGALSVSGGKLRIAGGTGVDGQTCLALVELIELGGALLLQHGELELQAASDGVIGGLYAGAVSAGACFAGFKIATSGSNSTIRALIGGVLTGPTITTAPGHRYLLSSRLYAREPYRMQQSFHSSRHPAGDARGGETISAGARVVLEVHDVDPVSPGTQAAPSTLLYDGVLAAPGFAAYLPVNAAAMHASLAFTRILRLAEPEVRSTIPAQSPRTRLVGSVAEGAACFFTPDNELRFYAAYVPVANEAIQVRYRNRGRAIARVQDAASISQQAGPGDDGIWAESLRVTQPAPRTSADCENAALALLDDRTRPAWSGRYECWSDFLPGGPAADPRPGDALEVRVPSRGAEFTAILREVEVELAEIGEDRCRYRLRFANDAAEPLAIAAEAEALRERPDPVVPGGSFLPDVSSAEITLIQPTTIQIDAGIAPPAGGGFEVRRTDFGWGAENDRNLVGRFPSQVFTVTRLDRVQTYHIRQYDSGEPRRYSRYSTVLHVDYPL